MSFLSLEGRVAFVTGSTRGIGWASARMLASHGASVVLNGHSNQEQLDQRVDEIRTSYGVAAMGLLADMADRAAVDACYRQIFAEHRRLDVLVNNAGILQDAVLGMIGADITDRTMAVNTVGMIANLQAAARFMRRNHSGSIINLSSIIATRGNSGQVLYGASKAAVVGMTLSAAKELARDSIRVNAVAPGFIDTDMVRQLPQDVFEQRVASIAMGRIGTPEDVARVVLFLATDLSQYVTGQVLGVDGGMLI